MKGIISITLLCFAIFSQAQTYISDSVSTYIFIQNNDEIIEGKNTSTNVTLDLDNLTIEASLEIKNFVFHKEKRKEYFLEDVMEYTSFKDATFKGKLKKVSNDSYYVFGTMTIHGKSIEINFPAKMVKHNNLIKVNASFTIMYPDYDISISKKEAKLINSNVVITIKSVLKTNTDKT